jgi:membrane protein implicated in regulation of membrane protease activity
MSFFTQTRASGPGRFLQWKVRLFAVAAVLLLIGMAREINLLVGAAIAILAIAFVLRFFEKEPENEGEEELEDEEHAGGEEPTAGDGSTFVVERRAGPANDEITEEPRRPLG